MRFALVMVEVFLKCLVGLVSGAGVGTLVFGLGLMSYGVINFDSSGPPPAPAAIGIGAGLLTMALTMTALFVGPLSQRRWFVIVEADDEPQRKWTKAG